jgi:hypothetical protein
MHSAVGPEIKELRAVAMSGKIANADISKSGVYVDAWSVLKAWERES